MGTDRPRAAALPEASREELERGLRKLVEAPGGLRVLTFAYGLYFDAPPGSPPPPGPVMIADILAAEYP